MSEPLKDKRLEAVVRMTLAVAHCDEEDKDITIDALREAASNADEIDIAKSRALFRAAIRETLAGELAQTWKDYFAAKTKTDMIIALEAAKHLLARFKELSHE